MQVHKLATNEAIVIDLDRFATLKRSVGSDWSTIDDLVAALCEVEQAWMQTRLGDLPRYCRQIAATAQQYGMTTFARVARDIETVSAGQNNPVALAALIARMVRVGEASLTAVWDLQDMRV